MGFDGPLEDRLAIRELMGTYADAAFRGDVEAYLACWTDDGVRAQGVSEIRGKAALRAMWDQIWAGLEKMAFFTELAGSEVRGDRATARVYCREILFLKGGGVRKVVGVYDDELERRDGAWLFARRTYRLVIDEPSRPDQSDRGMAAFV